MKINEGHSFFLGAVCKILILMMKNIANFRNTDLRHCVFLTQMQINSAKGNHNTKLPKNISYPALRQ